MDLSVLAETGAETIRVAASARESVERNFMVLVVKDLGECDLEKVSAKLGLKPRRTSPSQRRGEREVKWRACHGCQRGEIWRGRKDNYFDNKTCYVKEEKRLTRARCVFSAGERERCARGEKRKRIRNDQPVKGEKQGERMRRKMEERRWRKGMRKVKREKGGEKGEDMCEPLEATARAWLARWPCGRAQSQDMAKRWTGMESTRRWQRKAARDSAKCGFAIGRQRQARQTCA